MSTEHTPTGYAVILRIVDQYGLCEREGRVITMEAMGYCAECADPIGEGDQALSIPSRRVLLCEACGSQLLRGEGATT